MIISSRGETNNYPKTKYREVMEDIHKSGKQLFKKPHPAKKISTSATSGAPAAAGDPGSSSGSN